MFYYSNSMRLFANTLWVNLSDKVRLKKSLDVITIRFHWTIFDVIYRCRNNYGIYLEKGWFFFICGTFLTDWQLTLFAFFQLNSYELGPWYFSSVFQDHFRRICRAYKWHIKIISCKWWAFNKVLWTWISIYLA